MFRLVYISVVKDEILVLSSYSVQPVEDGTMLTVQAATWGKGTYIMQHYTYLSWMYGVDRKICHEGH